MILLENIFFYSSHLFPYSFPNCFPLIVQPMLSDFQCFSFSTLFRFKFLSVDLSYFKFISTLMIVHSHSFVLFAGLLLCYSVMDKYFSSPYHFRICILFSHFTFFQNIDDSILIYQYSFIGSGEFHYFSNLSSRYFFHRFHYFFDCLEHSSCFH